METEKLTRSAIDHYQSGNLEQAENICRDILKVQPDNSEVLHLLGLVFYRLGNHAQALKNIRKSVRLDPNYADAFFDLANILHEEGQTVKAVTNYRKAVKLSPDFAEAYNNMGIALQDNMKHDKAIKCYLEAIRSDANYAEAHNNLGVAYQEKGLTDQAINHFQKALLLKPDYTNAYHNLVDIIGGKGKDVEPATGKKPVYAVYRCLYGEDFLQESIRSISDHVDKIFIFRDDAPPGNITECIYKGETVKFPEKFDGVDDKIRQFDNPKIQLIHDHMETEENHLTHFVNDIILPQHEKPSVILYLEVDHVFRKDQISQAFDEFLESGYLFATTEQIEIWRDFHHRLPERPGRTGAIFCNLGRMNKMPETLRHGGVAVMPKLSAVVHNFGFAVSEEVMYWKHLLSLALAQKSGNNVPFEDWYEEKWLKWDYESNNENLHISEQIKITRAEPYNAENLPEVIQEKHPPV